MTHEEYMKRAIELALQGTGWVNPNPVVGAVIVKDGRIIGEGYHRKYGDLHAERDALKNCTEDPAGADIYVTLEPCCHHGKQPPCTEALIEAKIARVFVGSGDPNPQVAGKGLEILKSHGIEVFTGICEKECRDINEIFFHYIESKTPFVVMKYAMTMDGKAATRTGASQWITGEPARIRVHQDRHKFAAIMVGRGTAEKDNPELTCRIPNGKNPVRIVCDSKLTLSTELKLVQTAKEVPTIIATCVDDKARWEEYEKFGCRILCTASENGHVDLKELKTRLGQEGIDSIYIESGETFGWACVESGIADKVHAYVGAKIFGGKEALSPVGGFGVSTPAEAFMLGNVKVSTYGDDILMEADIIKS